VLEEVKDLSGQTFEILVVLQDVRNVQVSHLLAEALARLGQNISLHARVHVVLDVDGVLLRDLHEHTNVVLIVWVFLLVGVQEMLIFLQVLDYFPIHSFVLK